MGEFSCGKAVCDSVAASLAVNILKMSFEVLPCELVSLRGSGHLMKLQLPVIAHS